MNDRVHSIDEFRPQLDWIDQQRERMVQRVTGWANINSHSENAEGLGRMAALLQPALAALGGRLESIPLSPYQRIDERGGEVTVPLGLALRMVKRPEVRPRVFLAIHSDTVYPLDGPFQKAEMIDAQTLRGPGVADAKGGLAVMLLALEAVEQSPLAGRLGWEVVINPDEELGSPGSAGLFREAAGRNDLGLLFEPALDAGTLVSARRGSGNFTITVSGRSAHAGRDFERGRNAIVALAEIVTAVDALNRNDQGMTFNIGRIDGGGPVNVVPDRAVARLNVRITRLQQANQVTNDLAAIVDRANQRDGVQARCYGGVHAPPKPLDAPMLQLLERAAACGQFLGRPLAWKPSGGVCDGNRLAAWGLPNLDSLGAVGGDIHSPQEFLRIDSLTERAKLTALMMLTLARGDWAIAKPPPGPSR